MRANRHYAKAEELLTQANDAPPYYDQVEREKRMLLLLEAQVHATLALRTDK